MQQGAEPRLVQQDRMLRSPHGYARLDPDRCATMAAACPAAARSACRSPSFSCTVIEACCHDQALSRPQPAPNGTGPTGDAVPPRRAPGRLTRSTTWTAGCASAGWPSTRWSPRPAPPPTSTTWTPWPPPTGGWRPPSSRSARRSCTRSRPTATWPCWPPWPSSGPASTWSAAASWSGSCGPAAPRRRACSPASARPPRSWPWLSAMASRSTSSRPTSWTPSARWRPGWSGRPGSPSGSTPTSRSTPT